MFLNLLMSILLSWQLELFLCFDVYLSLGRDQIFLWNISFFPFLIAFGAIYWTDLSGKAIRCCLLNGTKWQGIWCYLDFYARTEFKHPKKCRIEFKHPKSGLTKFKNVIWDFRYSFCLIPTLYESHRLICKQYWTSFKF